MNELQVFNFKNNKVRTLTINNVPWFVAKDVAEALGYVKPRKAITDHVDNDDALKRGVTDNLGRIQETTIINESGLYSLVLSSRLESAKEFKRWVTSEVLPQIRKTGSYSIADPRKEIADLILKCNMVEQVELIRDLYNIPHTPQNSLVEPRNNESNELTVEPVKVLKNKDIPDKKERYKTIDAYLKTHKIREGDYTKEVYQDYIKWCKDRNKQPRTRHAFVLRMKEVLKLYTLSINGESTIQRRG